MGWGGNKIRVVAEQQPIVFGEEGLLLIKYVGWLDEYIVRTKISKYVFTKEKREQYIDSRDKNYFDNEYYDGVKVFECLWE